MKIGVLGLGIIGSVWARHYAAAGVLAGAWNRTSQVDFPGWRDTPEAVAEEADVIQIVVADPAAVEAVMARILPVLGVGKVVLQSSTIDPLTSEELHARVGATGAAYLEAPFTGSKPAAEQRRTVFYLGGEAALVAQVEPLLELVSEARLRIGDHRQAATLKLAMNLNIAAQMEALVESLTLARRAGIGDEVFFAALGRNVSHSGLATLKEPKLRAGDYSPQFSVKHMAKDMRLAAAMEGVTPPALAMVKAQLEAAEAAGWGDEDFCSLLRLVERGD